MKPLQYAGRRSRENDPGVRRPVWKKRACRIGGKMRSGELTFIFSMAQEIFLW
jgi:hypothetical protein